MCLGELNQVALWGLISFTKYIWQCSGVAKEQVGRRPDFIFITNILSGTLLYFSVNFLLFKE